MRIGHGLVLVQLEGLQRMLLLFFRLVFLAFARPLINHREQLPLFGLDVFLARRSLFVVPERDVWSFVIGTDGVRKLDRRAVVQRNGEEIVVANEGDALLIEREMRRRFRVGGLRQRAPFPVPHVDVTILGIDGHPFVARAIAVRRRSIFLFVIGELAQTAAIAIDDVCIAILRQRIVPLLPREVDTRSIRRPADLLGRVAVEVGAAHDIVDR